LTLGLDIGLDLALALSLQPSALASTLIEARSLRGQALPHPEEVSIFCFPKLLRPVAAKPGSNFWTVTEWANLVRS
jgi:hypothetical protein